VTVHPRPRAARAFDAEVPLNIDSIRHNKRPARSATRVTQMFCESIAIDYAPSNFASPEAAAERNFSPVLVFAAASEKRARLFRDRASRANNRRLSVQPTIGRSRQEYRVTRLASTL